MGIISTAMVGLHFNIVKYHGIAQRPPSIIPAFLKLDIVGALRLGLITVIFVFFFLDLFDTIGTLKGVSEEAGFMKNGKLPRAKQALLLRCDRSSGRSISLLSYLSYAIYFYNSAPRAGVIKILHLAIRRFCS